MTFSENRFPLFGIMLWLARTISNLEAIVCEQSHAARGGHLLKFCSYAIPDGGYGEAAELERCAFFLELLEGLTGSRPQA